MLIEYLERTTQLLHDLKQEIFAPGILVRFVNEARFQVAAEGECIRIMATQSTSSGTRIYPFSGISVGGASGVGAPLHVRQITVTNSGTVTRMDSYPFEFFNSFIITTSNSGVPTLWSQYAQGDLGSIYVDPVPNGTFTLNMDTVCYPVNLSDDTTPEAIPQAWQRAVWYYAAALGYLEAQQQDKAQLMFQLYEQFTGRARAVSTSGVLPMQFAQIPRVFPQRSGLAGSAQPPTGPESAVTPGGIGMQR